MSERKNGEYTIIQSIMIGNAEFVMGYNPKASTPYVTWECNNGNNTFGGITSWTGITQNEICLKELRLSLTGRIT